MILLDFYVKLLNSLDIADTDGEGLLSAFYAGDYTPITVGGKRLVLPKAEILREGNWKDRVGFHPLCEKITRTESPVLKLLKDVIGLKTDTVLIALLDALMHTAASPDLHKKVGGPKVAEYLKSVPGATEKTYKTLKKILEACKKPEYRLVNYYLKHGGKGEEAASRTCVVSFPIFDDLEEGNATVFGVKVDKKDRPAIQGLLEYVFGDKETRESYSYGSRNPEAPYFHALLTSFGRVAERINTLLDKHKKHVEGAVEMKIPVEDWIDQLDNFAHFKGMIPALDGNEGSVEKAGAKVEAPVPDLKERATRAFSRPEPVKEEVIDAPWEESEVAVPASRRPSPDEAVRQSDRRPEPAASSTGVMNSMDDFMAQFRKPQEESRSEAWGGAGRRREERRGFADTFREDRDDDRFETRRSRYDGPQRDRYNRDSGRGGRGGRHI